MKRYLVANWKSRKTIAEAEQWLARFLALYEPDPQLELIIAPAFIALPGLQLRLQEQGGSSIALAAQDLSPFPLGAYTGAVAAEQLRGLAQYAMVGHSERRRYFHETNQQVANKVEEALAAGLTPILCLDQPIARAQLAAIDEGHLPRLIIGYGPVEAVGIRAGQPPAQVAQVVATFNELAPDSPILYGGSVNASNAADYLQIPGLAGVMAATASLDPEEFAELYRVMRRN